MDRMLKAELDMKLESVFWSDSMTVLQYIASRTKRFKTYVANRISIIHGLSKVEQWQPISSKLNPADAASRAISDLRRAVAWILKLKEMLLLQREQRKNTHPDSQGQVHKPQQKVKTDTLRLSVSDLNAAEKAVFCFVQKQTYPEEVAALQTGTLKRTSHLFELDPQIVDGVLRVGGRLHRSALPEDTKHPVILPKSSHVSTLILRHIHQKVGHGGRNHMLWTLDTDSCTNAIKRLVCC